MRRMLYHGDSERKVGVKKCFMIFAAREYPSSKNHETPLRGEMSFEALRTAKAVLVLRIQEDSK
jgi:hypothetical protein